jgi:hypothetical protein
MDEDDGGIPARKDEKQPYNYEGWVGKCLEMNRTKKVNGKTCTKISLAAFMVVIPLTLILHHYPT